jgi:hypothetical protein
MINFIKANELLAAIAPFIVFVVIGSAVDVRRTR